MPLPVPWIGAGAIDVADLDQIAEFVENHTNAGEYADLVATLRQARARTDVLPTGLDIPRHVRCAQAMLEMAVEWRMPDVERWAVAWLSAAGGPHLRLRWSSRARDGRFRQETQTADRIISVAANEDRTILGFDSGAVISLAHGGEQRQLLAPSECPARVVAVRDHWVVAAGQRNWLAVSGWSSKPPGLLLPINGQKSAAIGPAGEIILGDERGRIQMWAPGNGKWRELCGGTSKLCGRTGRQCGTPGKLCAGTGKQALAVTFVGSPVEMVRVVWASGEVSELSLTAAAQDWRRLHSFNANVRAAAWSHDGAMLAAAVGQEVWLVCPSRSGDGAALSLWKQDGLHAVAWSATGILASASLDQIYSSTAPVRPDGAAVSYKSITSDELIDVIALPGRDHVISVWANQLVRWELSGAGSGDPTFSAKDPITAVGIQPGNRRLTLVGTEKGQLQAYDATGASGVRAQLGTTSKIKQLAWAMSGACWLVATLDGVYTYRPDNEGADENRGVRLAAGLCLHVASGGDRFAYAIEDRVVTSDPRTFTLSSPVLDLQLDPARGILAAIDEDGHVLVHRPGKDTPAEQTMKSGTRLLAVDGRQLLIRGPDDDIRWTANRGDRAYSHVPAGSSQAVPFDAERIVITYPDQGILLTGTGAGERSWAGGRVKAVAVSTNRIAVATPHHVAGFDVLDRRPAGDGTINLTAQSTDEGFEVTLPDGELVKLSGQALDTPSGEEAPNGAENLSQRVEDLSEAVFQAGQIGDVLWQAGLDLAIDQARGQDPNRAVRLRWNCPSGDFRADRFPWELLHPSTNPIGWFGEPPITTVRVVTATRKGWEGQEHINIAGESPTMVVARGTDGELSAVDAAFDRFRRRTRRTNVRLRTARPRAISNLDELAEVLAVPVDILQLWAHSGEVGLRFSRAGEIIPTAELASQIARAAPRLVVLVGCSSGALGRALVDLGVLAAVVMRVPVHDHTIQPLVEDVTTAVLAGAAVDLAFAAALRRYLFTGQPGAAAVPMLYLADDFNGVLFPQPLNTMTATPDLNTSSNLPTWRADA